jgi:hypothetical protein
MRLKQESQILIINEISNVQKDIEIKALQAKSPAPVATASWGSNIKDRSSALIRHQPQASQLYTAHMAQVARPS